MKLIRTNRGCVAASAIDWSGSVSMPRGSDAAWESPAATGRSSRLCSRGAPTCSRSRLFRRIRFYLTEPHIVSRVWEFDPNGSQDSNPRSAFNTGNELPALEDTGKVPHYLPGQNPDEDYMVRTYNLPKDAAMGFAYTLYPEYRKSLRGLYAPPPICGQYCCGWIERQGLPGAAPGLTCKHNNQPSSDRRPADDPRAR